MEIPKCETHLKLLRDIAFSSAESDRVPDLLYHYTSEEALWGILNNRLIRMSHGLFTNDPMEISYRKEIVIEGFNKHLGSGLPRASTYSCHDVSLLKYSHYFLSFTEECDNLSLWRIFAANGRGFALGFDIARLRSASRLPGTDLVPARVDYARESQVARIKRIYDTLGQWAQVGDEPMPPEPFLSTGLGLCAMTFKHESFSEEREWRVLPCPADHDDYVGQSFPVCLRGGHLVPYLGIPIDMNCVAPSPLREVVIGPSLDYGRTEMALNLLFTQVGFGCGSMPTIKESRCRVA